MDDDIDGDASSGSTNTTDARQRTCSVGPLCPSDLDDGDFPANIEYYISMSSTGTFSRGHTFQLLTPRPESDANRLQPLPLFLTRGIDEILHIVRAIQKSIHDGMVKVMDVNGVVHQTVVHETQSYGRVHGWLDLRSAYKQIAVSSFDLRCPSSGGTSVFQNFARPFWSVSGRLKGVCGAEAVQRMCFAL
eukprot:591708-Amphidinium_carterae.1